MNGVTLDLATIGDLGSWLWRANWQAGVLAALVVLVLWGAGRRIAPTWRHALWLLVVVRLCLPTLPASPVSVFNLWPVAPAPDANLAVSRPSSDGGLRVSVDFEPLASEAEGAVAAPSVRVGWLAAHWRSVVVIAWLIGAALLGGAVLLSHWRFGRRIRTGSDRVDDPAVLDLVERSRRELGVRRTVEVRSSADVGSPALFGAWRPMVLLPRDMLGFESDTLRFVLLHEMAHVKRRDVLINWVLTVVAIVHWFNPLVHYVVSRCRQERELICDEMVLGVVGPSQRRAYGRVLVDLFERLVGEPCPALAVGFFGRRSLLSRRIQMISTTTSNRRRGSIAAMVMFTALAGATLTDARVDTPPAGETPPAPALRKSVSGGAEVVPALEHVQDPQEPADSVTVVYDIRDLIEASLASREPALRSPLLTSLLAAESRYIVSEGDSLALIASRLLGDPDAALLIAERNGLRDADAIKVGQVLTLPQLTPEQGKAGAGDPHELAAAEISSLLVEQVKRAAGAGGVSRVGVDPRMSSLVITASPKAHQRIAALLADLRTSGQLMIEVETRFITGLTKLIGQGDVRIDLPAEGEPERVGVVTLTAKEIELISDATSRKGEVSLMASPRMLTMNGQRATLSIANSTEVAVPNADGSGEKINIKVDEGVSVEIRAFVMNDRKSVMLHVHPSVSQLDLSGPRPVQQRSEANLTITVPDGGAALIQLKSAPLALLGAATTLDLRGAEGKPIVVRGKADVPSQPLYILICPRLIIQMESETAPEPEASDR